MEFGFIERSLCLLEIGIEILNENWDVREQGGSV